MANAYGGQFGVTGLARLPVRRQPNGYTCGSTCVRIVLDHLEFLPGLCVAALTEQMGTNPRTGTTEIEMGRGLALARLTHAHPSVRDLSRPQLAISYLRQSIRDEKIVMLRLLMRGCKHWVVGHGFNKAGEFFVTCPASGRQSWSASQLHGYWAARGYDHFTVPGSRSYHPEALAWETEERSRNWKPVHEMTLREYVGTTSVVPNSKLSDWHRRMIAEAADAVRALAARPDGCLLAYRAQDYPALDFRAFARTDSCLDEMLVTEPASGEAVGGISHGVRWVSSGWRGRGLGSEIALAAHSIPSRRFLMPSSYSEAGYGSRVAAHALAVSRALAQGLDVPIEVMQPDRDPAAGEGGRPLSSRRRGSSTGQLALPLL